MKTMLFLLCFLCATLAMGQSVGGTVLSSQPQVFTMPSHPEQAASHSMGQEHNLFESSGFSYAKGERPLWEVFHSSSEAMSLGDAARLLRKQHETAKKAEKVWEN